MYGARGTKRSLVAGGDSGSLFILFQGCLLKNPCQKKTKKKKSYSILCWQAELVHLTAALPASAGISVGEKVANRDIPCFKLLQTIRALQTIRVLPSPVAVSVPGASVGLNWKYLHFIRRGASCGRIWEPQCSSKEIPGSQLCSTGYRAHGKVGEKLFPIGTCKLNTRNEKLILEVSPCRTAVGHCPALSSSQWSSRFHQGCLWAGEGVPGLNGGNKLETLKLLTTMLACGMPWVTGYPSVRGG